MNRDLRSLETMTSDDEYVPVGYLCTEKAIDRLGGSRSLYANVVGRFLDDSAGNFAQLRTAVADGDIPQLKRSAHSLKGLAAMCGAESVHDTLARLEEIKEINGDESAADLLEHIELEMTEAQRVLSSFRNSSAG